MIDTLLQLRERHRSSELRKLLRELTEVPSGDIIGAWKKWLISFNKEAVRKEFDSTERRLLSEMGYQTSSDPKAISRLLGTPVGSHLDDPINFSSLKRVKQIEKKLVPYLGERKLPREHPAWTDLYKDLTASIQKLDEISSRFSMFADPDIAASLIGISGYVDKLKTEYNMEHGSKLDHERISLAITIGRGIAYSLRLKYYLAKD